MTKSGRVANFTLPNGDIIQKRIVRHKEGGRISIKRTKIACGIIMAPKKAPPEAERIPLDQSVAPEPKKKQPKKKLIPITAAPKTIRTRLHSTYTEFDGSSYIESIKAAYVNTTNTINETLRKAKAISGSHVEQFQRDHEAIGSDLSSMNLGGARGGGGGLPLPLSKIQAQDRIRTFQKACPESYMVCCIILLRGGLLPASNGEERRKAEMWTKKAMIDLATFYTAKKTRPNQSLIEGGKAVSAAMRSLRG